MCTGTHQRMVPYEGPGSREPTVASPPRNGRDRASDRASASVGDLAQASRQVDVTGVRGERDGVASVVCGSQRIGPGRQEQLGQLDVAVLGRLVQRREPPCWVAFTSAPAASSSRQTSMCATRGRGMERLVGERVAACTCRPRRPPRAGSGPPRACRRTGEVEGREAVRRERRRARRDRPRAARAADRRGPARRPRRRRGPGRRRGARRSSRGRTGSGRAAGRRHPSSPRALASAGSSASSAVTRSASPASMAAIRSAGCGHGDLRDVATS